MGYSDIANVVKKKDGTHPTESSVREAVKAFTTKGKKKAGRPKGSFKTSKEEDKQIMTAFHKVRPPGAGVTARKVHKALPKKLNWEAHHHQAPCEEGLPPPRQSEQGNAERAQQKEAVGFLQFTQRQDRAGVEGRGPGRFGFLGLHVLP